MAVYQKNGTYWIDYYYHDRRYRQKIGSRRRDAEEALSRIRVNIAAGEFIPPEERQRQEAFQRQPMLFETFALEEFLPWSEAEHAAGHHHQQRIILRAHLAPYFEGMHLHEITPKRIEDYKGIRVKKANRATVNREVFCLKKLLRKAVEWGKLEENPAAGIKSFKETPQAPRLLEVEEVARLQEACRQEPCPVDLYALVCCIVYAGLRKAEVFNLRWDGIDWKREELTVQSRPEWHTKNYQSRTIPMSEMLAEALRCAPRRLGCPLVFPTPEGTTYKNTHYIEAALDRAAVRAGIEGGVTFHQLRHTFCSHAQMQGVPVSRP
jgi:integrase